MIIDGHSHVTFPIEEHIKAMDKAGIDKTILFSTTFHPEQAINTHEVKEQMKYLNDLLSGKIITTRSTGGLLYPYKGLLPTLEPKGSSKKIHSRTNIYLLSPIGLILFALFYRLTRERVYVFF